MDEVQYYDDFYQGEVDRVNRSHLIRAVRARLAVEFRKKAGLTQSSRVLNLGCGDGSTERLLAPHVAEVIGVDLSPVAVAHARQLAKEEHLANVEYQVHDLTTGFPWESGSFDAVCMLGFLHHIREAFLQGLIEGTCRILRAGGTAYSVDPSSRRLIRWLKPLVKSTYERLHTPDEREFDPAELRRRFKDAGFVSVKVQPVDYFSVPLGFLLPQMPSALTRPAQFADTLACRLPGISSLASSMAVVARAG